MELSAAELQMIHLFLQKNDFLTAKQIADCLYVSSKTVYRKIKSINEKAKSELIISEKGRGYKLDYQIYMESKFENSRSLLGFTPQERRNKILLQLLFKAPKYVFVDSLYEDYYVSHNAIKHDFLYLEDLLKNYDLSLKRKVKQVRITGSEEAIRAMINELDLTTINHADTNDYQDLNKMDVDFIHQQLEYMERKFHITIPYPYDINIFSHLYILINRSRQGEVDSFNDFTIKNQKQEYPSLYKIAELIIANIATYLGKAIPNIEIEYFVKYLLASRLDSQATTSKTTMPLLVEQVADLYIAEVMPKLPVKSKLRNELMNHIKPMLNRIQHHIHVKNNLLTEIQFEYGDIFKKIDNATKKIATTFGLADISKDEIGFITIYFAKYLEEMRNTKKIIIMCSSGIGTSELLQVKVRKAFPDLEIVDVVSSSKLKKRNYPNVDFILTTIKPQDEPPVPILLVSAMFTEKDKQMVKKLMETL